MTRSRAAREERSARRRFARIVVFLRWPILVLWLGAVATASGILPTPRVDEGAGLQALVPPDSPALRTEMNSIRRFGLPLLSRTLVVQRDPAGLPLPAQAAAITRAVSVTSGDRPDLELVAGAVPITNALGFFPSSSEQGTTVLTYLFFRPGISLADQETLAWRYARLAQRNEDHVVGITGAAPGRLEQARAIGEHQTLVEIATVALILLIVGVHFRALGAPLLTLGAAGIAYGVAIRVVGWALGRFDIAFPQELEPLMVVLLLGIVTDYSIFFLEHARRRLREGHDARDAARHSASELVSIVTTAGLVVALGSAALIVAGLETYRTLGPGLALTVVVGLLVTITLVPAGIAVFGRVLFRPSADATVGEARTARRTGRWRRKLAYLMAHRAVAIALAIPILAALVAAATHAPALNLGFSLTSALPRGSSPREAGVAAGEGFAPGIVSPTMLVIDAPEGERLDVDRLSALQGAIERREGIAGVVGPREISRLGELVDEAAAAPGTEGSPTPTPSDPTVAAYRDEAMRTVLTDDGGSARMLVILGSDPLGGPAIDTVEALGADLPALLGEAGLGDDVRASLAGDTALASDTIDQTMRDLRTIAVVVIVLMLLLLALFLRSLVAPFYLLAISVLGYLATLGIAAWVFTNVFHTATTTFFVPFASAVLLVALGSDYNIFLAGRIWDEARREPLRDAIATAAPDASRAIGVAGVTLAGSFGVLALVPIEPMRQLAFVMAAGILLDTFVVRAILVPAIVAAVGPVGAWPGRFRKGGGVEPPALAAETDEAAADGTQVAVPPAPDYVRR